MKNKIRTTYDPKYWRAIAHPKVRKYSMKTLWNKLLDWIVQLKFPFYFDDHFSTVAWKWHGGYGKWDNSAIVIYENFTYSSEFDKVFTAFGTDNIQEGQAPGL